MDVTSNKIHDKFFPAPVSNKTVLKFGASSRISLIVPITPPTVFTRVPTVKPSTRALKSSWDFFRRLEFTKIMTKNIATTAPSKT
jgi:hypothetical protein